jgi:hypothetical protein
VESQDEQDPAFYGSFLEEQEVDENKAGEDIALNKSNLDSSRMDSGRSTMPP